MFWLGSITQAPPQVAETDSDHNQSPRSEAVAPSPAGESMDEQSSQRKGTSCSSDSQPSDCAVMQAMQKKSTAEHMHQCSSHMVALTHFEEHGKPTPFTWVQLFVARLPRSCQHLVYELLQHSAAIALLACSLTMLLSLVWLMSRGRHASKLSAAHASAPEGDEVWHL